MGFAMANPAFKTELFRFVDVFPATDGSADVVDHLQTSTWPGSSPPLAVSARALGLDGVAPLGKAVTARVATPNDHSHGAPVHRRCRAQPMRSRSSTRDVGARDCLHRRRPRRKDGERRRRRTIRSARRRAPCPPQRRHGSTGRQTNALEQDDRGAIPRLNMSVKPTALSPRYAPLTRDEGLEEVAARLRPILRRADDAGVLVNFDMEHVEVKDMTLELVRSMAAEEEFATLNFGVAVQTYLKDVPARPRVADRVLGAPRDAAHGAARERRLLGHRNDPREGGELAATGLRAQAANRRELRGVHATPPRPPRRDPRRLRQPQPAFDRPRRSAQARARGIADDGYEFQMLYGMAEPIHEAVRRARTSACASTPPSASSFPGMAYLVRRLLENTANESFVRARLNSGTPLERVARGAAGRAPRPGAARRAGQPTDPEAPGAVPAEPPAEWHRHEVRESSSRRTRPERFVRSVATSRP